MGLSLNPDEKNKKRREKKTDRRTLKASATNTDTKLYEVDDQTNFSVTLHSWLQIPHIKFN